MARKPFRTPPTLPSETQCRGIVIPASREWLGLYSDALLELTKSYNYNQVEPTDLTPEETASLMYLQYVDWLNSTCDGPCPPPNINGKPIIRINPTTGAYEQLADDGVTWEPTEGDYAVPPIEARTEPTEAERICAASTNAVYVMRQLYDESLSMWENQIAPLAAFEAFGDLAGELANAVLTAILGAFAPIAATAWGIFYFLMDQFTQNVWTDNFNDRLICLFQENAIYTDGVVTFNYNGITGGLWSSDFLQNVDPRLLAQLAYFFSIVGVDGLNLAGETTAVTGDCDYCDGWCYTVDLTATNFGMGNVTVYNVNGSLFCGAGGGGSWANGTGWTIGKAVGRTFTRSNITEVSVVAVVNSGAGSPRMAVELYDPQGARSYDRNSGVVARATDTVGTQTLTWTGTVMASEIALLRCTSSGTTIYKTITFRGNGTNPFGADNC